MDDGNTLKLKQHLWIFRKETAKTWLRGNIKQLPREMRLSGHAMIWIIFSKVHDFTIISFSILKHNRTSLRFNKATVWQLRKCIIWSTFSYYVYYASSFDDDDNIIYEI